jgi:hypothetical protein
MGATHERTHESVDGIRGRHQRVRVPRQPGERVQKSVDDHLPPGAVKRLLTLVLAGRQIPSRERCGRVDLDDPIRTVDSGGVAGSSESGPQPGSPESKEGEGRRRFREGEVAGDFLCDQLRRTEPEGSHVDVGPWFAGRIHRDRIDECRRPAEWSIDRDAIRADGKFTDLVVVDRWREQRDDARAGR